jgi:Na+/melibiose symporter-like transporter
MIAGYSPEAWGDLFLAAAGATAALSGLIFVGLSVNIRTVLDTGKREGQNFLTGRAIEALAALLIVLVISLVGLTPDIPRGALATFILVSGLGSATSPVRALLASRHQAAMDAPLLLRLVTAAGLTVTLLLSGVTLATGHGGGLYWLPAAFVLAIVIAAINAWVLLVEVLR